MTDIIDKAQDLEEKQRAVFLRIKSKQINAMKKISSGTCIDCDDEIEQQRLTANPYSLRCIECQNEYEGN